MSQKARLDERISEMDAHFAACSDCPEDPAEMDEMCAEGQRLATAASVVALSIALKDVR